MVIDITKWQKLNAEGFIEGDLQAAEVSPCKY